MTQSAATILRASSLQKFYNVLAIKFSCRNHLKIIVSNSVLRETTNEHKHDKIIDPFEMITSD